MNTAIRELYYTAKMNELLKPLGMVAGNLGYGLWHYDREVEGNACPLVDKYCGLYRTYGDKRLAANLIQGLLKLVEGASSEELLKRFGELGRVDKDGRVTATYTTVKMKDPWSKWYLVNWHSVQRGQDEPPGLDLELQGLL